MEKTHAHFKKSPQRCPYCHDDVVPDASVVCQDCLARHHEACWGEGGACAACSSTTLMQAALPQLSWEIAYSLLSERGYDREAVDEALRSGPAGAWSGPLGSLLAERSTRVFLLCFVLIPLVVAFPIHLGVWAYNDFVAALASRVNAGISVVSLLLGLVLGLLNWLRLRHRPPAEPVAGESSEGSD